MATSLATPDHCTIAKSPATPRRLIATTKKPETAPPRRAGCTALLRSFVAPAAVRMLERMATHIPMYPAAMEQRAPRTNAIVVQSASSDGLLVGSLGFEARTKAYRI